MAQEQSTTEQEGTVSYPFDLSGPGFFLLILVVGILLPGIGVYGLDQAGLVLASDLLWIAAYGTTAGIIWYLWIRPLDLTGSANQSTTLPEIDNLETGDNTESSASPDDSSSPEARPESSSSNADGSEDTSQ